MARMATASSSARRTSPPSARNWSVRSTSVNYAPQSTELAGCTPERFYWHFTVNGQDLVMLPQMPCRPHITEVRLLAKAVSQPPARPPSAGNEQQHRAAEE